MLKLLPKLNKQWINEMNPSIYLSIHLSLSLCLSLYVYIYIYTLNIFYYFFPSLFNVFEY